MGSRLGTLTAHRPKCLLPLDSETIIDRQLRLLQEVGVSTITVVVENTETNSLRSIWNGPALTSIRRSILSGNSDRIVACKDCSIA